MAFNSKATGFSAWNFMWWFVFQKMMTKSSPRDYNRAMYIIVPSINKALVEEVTENRNSIAKIEFLWRALNLIRVMAPLLPPFLAANAIKITLIN